LKTLLQFLSNAGKLFSLEIILMNFPGKEFFPISLSDIFSAGALMPEISGAQKFIGKIL
jgi:hypothetical protein